MQANFYVGVFHLIWLPVYRRFKSTLELLYSYHFFPCFYLFFFGFWKSFICISTLQHWFLSSVVLILPLTASHMGFNVLLHFQFLYNHSSMVSSHPIVFSAHNHLFASCPSLVRATSFLVMDHCWRSALPSNLPYGLSFPF